MRQFAKFLLFSVLLLLVQLPVAFVVTILLYPFWSWIEASYGVESVGHSGPADWCFLVVYGLLAIAGTAMLARKIWRHAAHNAGHEIRQLARDQVRPEAMEPDVHVGMPGRSSSFSLAATLYLGLFAFAFVAAPHACEWGFSAYFWSGVAVVIALLALPIVLHREQTWLRRGLFSVGLGTLGSVVWVAGLFAANVRIICRLF